MERLTCACAQRVVHAQYACYVAIQAAGRMASWTDEETLKLIEVCGEESIQAMLEGSKRNRDVFNKIAREMEAAGYESSRCCSSVFMRLQA